MKLLTALTVALALACNESSFVVDRCTTAPPIHYAPPDTTVAVGDTVPMRVTIDTSTCYATLQSVPIRWMTWDTTVATVDSLSGLVNARHAGTTEVVVKALALYSGAYITVTGP